MIEIRFDGTALERALQKAIGEDARKAALAQAATRVAGVARKAVVERLPEVFDRPTSYTLHSIRYAPATPDRCVASVYISDDANRGLSPRKYLGPEIGGGPRGYKRSERALQIRGIMRPGQYLEPAEGLPLDAHGNVRGSLMLRILSRIGGLTEAGFAANASATTRRKLKKNGPTVKQTGTDYFVANSHADHGLPFGIYRIVGKGRVRPMFIFANKAPDYRARFHFSAMVERIVRSRFAEHMRRALLDAAK